MELDPSDALGHPWRSILHMAEGRGPERLAQRRYLGVTGSRRDSVWHHSQRRAQLDQCRSKHFLLAGLYVGDCSANRFGMLDHLVGT